MYSSYGYGKAYDIISSKCSNFQDSTIFQEIDMESALDVMFN